MSSCERTDGEEDQGVDRRDTEQGQNPVTVRSVLEGALQTAFSEGRPDESDRGCSGDLARAKIDCRG